MVVERILELPDCSSPDLSRGCTAAREPTFAVGPSGEIWLTGANGPGGASQLWHSPDLGITWEHVPVRGADALRQTSGLEGDVAVDGAGVVYLFETNLYEAWWTVMAGRDGLAATIPFTGTATSIGQHATDVATPELDRPWLRPRGASGLDLYFNDGRTVMQSTDDGGITWGPLQVLSECGLGYPFETPQGIAISTACNTLVTDLAGQESVSSAPMLLVPSPEGLQELPMATPLAPAGTLLEVSHVPHTEGAFYNGTWFMAGTLEGERRAYLSMMQGSSSNGTWLGDNASWMPTLAVRDDGLLAVTYVSEEDGWRLITELRRPDATILDRVDLGLVDTEGGFPSRSVIGDFLFSRWLPDGTLGLAYGISDGVDSVESARSLIKFARLSVEHAPA